MKKSIRLNRNPYSIDTRCRFRRGPPKNTTAFACSLTFVICSHLVNLKLVPNRMKTKVGQARQCGNLANRHADIWQFQSWFCAGTLVIKKKEKRKKRANQLDWKSTQHMYKIEKCAFNWINILLNFVSAIWQEQIGVNLTYLRACGRGIRPGGGAVNQRFSKLRSKHDKNFLSIYGEVEREG